MPKKLRQKGTPRCDDCRHPGFWRIRAWDGRPLFVCDKCRSQWTSGHGDPYLGHEMNPEKDLPEWVKEYDCEPVQMTPEIEEIADKFCRFLDSIPKPRPNRKPSTIEKRRKKRGIPDPKLAAGMRRVWVP